MVADTEEGGETARGRNTCVGECGEKIAKATDPIIFLL